VNHESSEIIQEFPKSELSYLKQEGLFPPEMGIKGIKEDGDRTYWLFRKKVKQRLYYLKEYLAK